MRADVIAESWSETCACAQLSGMNPLRCVLKFLANEGKARLIINRAPARACA